MNTTIEGMTETPPKTKRKPPLSIRVPLDKEEAFWAAYAASGYSTVNAFVVDSVLRKNRRFPAKTRDTAAEITALQHLTDALNAFDPLTISDPLIAEQLADLLTRHLEHNAERTIALLRDAGWKP